MSSIEEQKLSLMERAVHREIAHQSIAERIEREVREQNLEWHRRRWKHDSQNEQVDEKSEHDA